MLDITWQKVPPDVWPQVRSGKSILVADAIATLLESNPEQNLTEITKQHLEQLRDGR